MRSLKMAEEVLDPPPKKKRTPRRRARLNRKAQAALKAQENAQKERERAIREEEARIKREAAALAEQQKKREAEEKAKRELEEKIQAEMVAPKDRGTKYNHPFGPDICDRDIELLCFGNDWGPEEGGLGAFEHFKKFCALFWPWLEWNPWLEDQIRSLTSGDYVTHVGDTTVRFVSWTGCGGGGKTFASGLFACAWFLVDPINSVVTLTSTTKTIISQRVWPVIQRFYHEAKDPISNKKYKWGHMIDSQKMVQALKGDAKHSISAVAVESGEIQKALDKVKGRHAARMLLIVDEANTTPRAIFECIPNMAKGCDELIVLVMGNAVSRLDNHGRCCEPLKGWTSVQIEDDYWPTKGVDEWNLPPGICCHYDGARSPNVKVGRTVFPYLYSYENWQTALKSGEDYQNTVQFWSQERGFWPPDGIVSTVFSEAMVEKYDGRKTTKFMTEATPCAALDTAFGGDQCVLQFGLIGDMPNGRRCIQLTSWTTLGFDPKSTDEYDFQLARRVIRECETRGIAPKWFGGDATGTGRGVMQIIAQEWSSGVHKVEFGGSASDMPASSDDSRPAKDVYANKVTELWFSAREFLTSGQLKGLYHEAVEQFCSREYKYLNRKIVVERKDDMKKKIGRSPDNGDAIAVLIEVARKNGIMAGNALKVAVKKEDAWSDLKSSLTELYENAYVEDAAFSPYVEV